MADKQRDDDKEPLNEREREVLQELERQMVSEVEEAGRHENDKARVDLWRIIAVLNMALLAGIGATGAFLDGSLSSSIHLLVVSVLLNLSSLLITLFALALASMVVVAEHAHQCHHHHKSNFLSRMALLRSLLRVGSKRVSPSAPCIEPGSSSKLARSDTYARWTFLQTNFLENAVKTKF